MPQEYLIPAPCLRLQASPCSDFSWSSKADTCFVKASIFFPVLFILEDHILSHRSQDARNLLLCAGPAGHLLAPVVDDLDGGDDALLHHAHVIPGLGTEPGHHNQLHEQRRSEFFNIDIIYCVNTQCSEDQYILYRPF